MPESAPSSPATASREAVCSSAAPASVPSLSRAEVRELLFDLPWPELQALAHQCRLRHKGRHVHVRGLLEFSNACRRNCRYCGLRHENRRLSRYSLSAAELLRAASQAVAAGVTRWCCNRARWPAIPSGWRRWCAASRSASACP